MDHRWSLSDPREEAGLRQTPVELHQPVAARCIPDTDNSFECTLDASLASQTRHQNLGLRPYLLPSLRKLLLGTSNKQLGQ
jgi:hypothetical protein